MAYRYFAFMLLTPDEHRASLVHSPGSQEFFQTRTGLERAHLATALRGIPEIRTREDRNNNTFVRSERDISEELLARNIHFVEIEGNEMPWYERFYIVRASAGSPGGARGRGRITEIITREFWAEKATTEDIYRIATTEPDFYPVCEMIIRVFKEHGIQVQTGPARPEPMPPSQ